MAGADDVLEPAARSTAWLERTLRQAGNLDVTVKLFPRGHHSLLLGVAGTPSEFTTMRGISQLVPGYWDVLTGWLGRASRARPSRDSARTVASSSRSRSSGAFCWPRRSPAAGANRPITSFFFPFPMPTRRISAARNVMGDVLVLVGTTKGAFVFTSDAARTRWRVDGPHFPGEAVVFARLRPARGAHSPAGRSAQQPLGGDDPHERRLRKDVERARTAGGALSGIVGAVARAGVADRAGTPGGARRRVVRRRAGGALPVGRRRGELGAGRGAARSRAPAEVDAGRRRAVSAHHRARSDQSRPHGDRHLHRRLL